MNKQDIIARLEALNLPRDGYWLITGTAMVMYGLRDITHDIDMGCTPQVADMLSAQGHPCTVTKDGRRKIVIGEDIEIFEGWLYDTVQFVDNIPVISLKGLTEMKRTLGRDKDLRDIALIEAYLSRNSCEELS